MACADGSARIWNLNTRVESAQLPASWEPMTGIAWSPDGKSLVSARGAAGLQQWNAATGKDIRRFKGRIVATPRNDKGAIALDETTVNQVAFSSDGKLIAASTWYGTIGLWSAATGTLVRTLELRPLKETEERVVASADDIAVQSFAFSPNGQTLTGAAEDGTVCFWDVATGRRLGTVKHERTVLRVSYAPDSSTVAVSGGGNVIAVYQPATGAEVRKLDSPCGDWMSTDMKYSPDGGVLATRAHGGMLCLWPQTPGQPHRVLREAWNPMQVFAISLDGRALASGAGEGVVRVWNLAEGTAFSLRRSGGWINFIGLSPDGRSVATIWGAELQLWRFGQPGKAEVLDVNALHNAAFSPDGAILAWGNRLNRKSHPVRLANLARLDEPRREWRHDNDVHHVAWSPDGRFLATAPDDLSAPDAPVVRIWDARSGTVYRDIRPPKPITATPVFSRVSRRLATACGNQIQLWDVESAAEFRKLEGHQQRVRSMAWSHDGKTLVSDCGDGTVRLWSVESGAELRKLHTGISAQSVTFSPDGTLIAFAVQEGPFQVVTPDGRLVLSIHARSLGDEAVILSAGSSPRVEILGHDRDRAAESVFCHVGGRRYPYDLCRDRVESTRLGWKVLNNDPNPDVP